VRMKIRLKELRKMRGLTQDQLGDLIGAAKSHISEMESGKKNPSGPMLERIATVFGLRVSEVFDEGDKDLSGLIRDYEALSPEDQAVIRRLAHQLSSRASD